MRKDDFRKVRASYGVPFSPFVTTLASEELGAMYLREIAKNIYAVYAQEPDGKWLIISIQSINGIDPTAWAHPHSVEDKKWD